MPPPPPPSKSYLLVLDTDSEDEDDYRVYQREVTPPSPQAAEQTMAVEPETSSICHVIEDEDATNDSPKSHGKKLSKSQKRNRRRRMKKKTQTSSPKKESKPGVSFSSIRIRSFPRCFSGDAVPADGGWPLGMEREQFYDGEEYALEDYENEKQQKLKERWESVMHKCDSSVIETMKSRPPNCPFLFETRQWDYKSGVKNPLFSVCSEQQRQALFLGTPPEVKDHGHPPSPKRRTRSNSVTSDQRRTRSNSVTSEQFNDTYTQVVVHHARHELEEIRNFRSKSGATGCNCRKLSVYLPPKDGSAGKRAQHRRMKPSKLTQELKKRGLYDPSASREQLEITLHDAVAKEPCCRSDDCFCFRNGIDCQSDACSCWHDSHVHAKPGSAFPSIDEIQTRCGNPLGMYTVDLEAIDSFRSKVLESMICQPISQ